MKTVKRRNNSRSILPIVVFWILVGFGLPQRIVFADNPYSLWVTVRYIYEGEPYAVANFMPACRYIPGESGYDDCETSEGNGFDHCHTTGGFPIEDGPRTVQSSHCDDYWDDQCSGYTQQSGATCSENCHGYATGRSYWVNGIDVILEDEWQSINEPVDGCISSTSSHSILITNTCRGVNCTHGGCCPDVVIKITYEKNGSSGVYSISYACPDGDGTGSDLYEEQ